MKVSEIRIPEPCSEDWGGMTPEQRGRFCAACQKTVHDLSAMPESDAKSLLQSDADICVSYLSDSRGEVRFQPEPIVPLRRLVRRASVATAAGLSLALAACTPHGEGPSLEDGTEAPAFLEVRPSIPDAEPCASSVIEALTRTQGEPMPIPEDTVERTKGDVAKPEPIEAPDPHPKPRLTRTAGKPSRPNQRILDDL